MECQPPATNRARAQLRAVHAFRPLYILSAVTALSVAGCGKHQKDGPVAFACGRAPGESALMTIVLPPDWSNESGEQGSMRVQKYVFTSPEGAYPYVWVQVEQVAAQTLADKRKEAADHSGRDFLAGGELGENYFDSGRNILWMREKEEHGNGSVTATLFDKYVATFRFFQNRSRLDDFEPVIVAIIDNLRTHNLEERVIASNDEVDFPDWASTSAFTRAVAKSSGFTYIVFTLTVLVLGTLGTIEYRNRKQREEERQAAARQSHAAKKAKLMAEKSAEQSVEASLRKSLRNRS